MNANATNRTDEYLQFMQWIQLGIKVASSFSQHLHDRSNLKLLLTYLSANIIPYCIKLISFSTAL